MPSPAAVKQPAHVVLSFGDVVRQSGYRTRVLCELREYDTQSPLQTFFIAFDRDASRFHERTLHGADCRIHGRRSVYRYFPDLISISRNGPIRRVHAHNLYSAALALSARRLFGYRVILDLHGRIPEEYRRLNKGNTLSRWVLERLEATAVRRADHVIVVSQQLKDYLVQNLGLPPERATVIPMCADGSQFKWDEAQRAAARRRLSFENKFICVHLGSFFTWYDPNLIATVFNRIRSRVPSAHLLIVTEEAERAATYLRDLVPPEAFTVLSASHDEVPPLLAASDLGFLLLRSSPNIRVSSPAKLPEYLNSGLPALITPEVGDFSAFIQQTGAGAVVSEDGIFDVSFAEKVFRNREDFARRCVEAGEQLTWQAFLPAWRFALEAADRRAR